jgi:alkylhydroperoxidase family enzyme
VTKDPMRRLVVALLATVSLAGCASMHASPPPDATRVARVPLVAPDTNDPIVGPIFRGIQSRGGEPLNMHRAVANSPKIFKSYVDMALALRAGATTPRADRELIILRTAQLAGGDYEFAQHRPMAVSCGITAAQLDALGQWRSSSLFTDKQRAILAYVDGMGSPGGVDEATFAALKQYFNDAEIVELTVTSAFYGMVSQITRSLDVKLEPNAGQTAYGTC